MVSLERLAVAEVGKFVKKIRVNVEERRVAAEEKKIDYDGEERKTAVEKQKAAGTEKIAILKENIEYTKSNYFNYYFQ